MPGDLGVPRLSYDALRGYAEEFLARYHPEQGIPIPIEEIVDNRMGINIVPEPGLHALLDIDGFISSDLKNLYVESYVFESRPTRYRFTLAHEAGHLMLHQSIYSQARFDSVDEWRLFVNGLSDNDHRWLEWQANCFAGLVLVPQHHLLRLTDEAVQAVKGEGVSLRDNRDFAWAVIAEWLAKAFEVSSQVVDKRLAKDVVKEECE